MDFQRKIIMQNDKVKVIQVGENEYEVFSFSTRNEDGIVSSDWHFLYHCTNYYMRDWLGRTCSKHYNPNNEPNFAYEEALRLANSQCA